jgi:glutathione S-transferase
MHPDIQRDINQKVHDGLITVKDSRLILKYLAERQTIRGLEPLSLLSEFQFLISWAEYLKLSKATYQ